MRINKSYQIEKASTEDETRPGLSQPILNVERKEVIATNGRIIAVVPVEVENGDTSGFIPCEAFKLDRKNKSAGMVVNGSVQVGTTTLARNTVDQLGRFPNTDLVLNQHKDKEPVIEITLNAELLKDLADALGSSKGAGLTLSIYGALEAVKVAGKNGAYGMIMPIRGEK